MMRKLVLMSIVMLAMAGVSRTPALGSSYVTDGFDSVELVGNGEDGGWYVDRYAPQVFETESFDGDNRLKLGLRAEGQQANRGSQDGDFYNYQGRKINTPHNGQGTYVSIDMYLDESWQTGTRAGMWATTENGGQAYPIIEFVVDGDNSDYEGTSDFTGFRFWQSGQGWDDGVEMDADDAWHNMKIELDGSLVRFYLDESEFATAASHPDASISNVILQGHNEGTAGEYDIYFDNMTTAVPEPLTMLAVGSAVAGLGGYIRRRRRG